ncbi:hypothetical protein RJ641_012151 [Dillenia turbinata]|uniref:DUF7054 domain-containing protein n=1 Tax=Dillenia turbinata TaxID=194707 RepID=A0AAN8Z085_9MAGN
MLMLKNKKNSQNNKGNRLLISVTVLGSAGPIRFIVNEEELVAAVIVTALKSYAREGRLPVLGTDLNNFLLYCSYASTEALSPWETIGSYGGRNFMLCKKPEKVKVAAAETTTEIARKGQGSWKNWINRSFNLKISSH